MFRLEDVHSRVPASLVLRAGEIARELSIPMQVALIPVFTDPFVAYGPIFESWLPLDRDTEFLKTIRDLKAKGASFIWHGVTHQLNDHKNPSGAAGDDWEFWDAVTNSPVKDDSVAWVLQRLNSGYTALKNSGVEIQVWEVPHYQASVLDYFIFGRVFSWNIGRISYRPFSASGLPERASDLLFERTGAGGHLKRESALKNLRVQTHGYSAGQFFPFPIFQDAYGQRVFPENLGYVELPQGGETKLRTVDDILRDAKRNLVLRDVWGSFFFHPFILNQPGGENELRRLLSSMKAMGYRFIDLKEFTKR